MIYIFDAGGSGQFVEIDRFAGGLIAGGQAFWAKGSAGILDRVFQFRESNKIEVLFAPFYKADEQFENSLIVNMEMVSNTNYADHTTIRFDDEATFDWEGTHDAYKRTFA